MKKIKKTNKKYSNFNKRSKIRGNYGDYLN